MLYQNMLPKAIKYNIHNLGYISKWEKRENLKSQPSVTKNGAAQWKIHKNPFLQVSNQNNIWHH
jgi:hypothetical protein